mgnify:FL=1
MIEVKLIDKMGSDLTVVNAARVSFHKESKVLTEKDKKLIEYLAKHKHTTPFRHVQFQFRCKAPIFLARQLGKHQTGMSWNEVSRRYVDSLPDFYYPEVWRKRPDGGIKQGSKDEPIELNNYAHGVYDEFLLGAQRVYLRLLEIGVAPELARIVLPQSMVTEWIWTGSMLAFFNVWKQRSDGHAQYEAREFARLLDTAIPEDCRFSWEVLKRWM